MQKLLTTFLLLLLSLPTLAIENGHVKYAGGTLPRLNSGVAGRLDVTNEISLTFEFAGKKIEIPYASIQSSEYSCVVARHLGVLPAIVVALLRARQHRHVFRISYLDQNNLAQVAIFEVPKDMPRTLLAALDARAAHSFKPQPCHWSKWIEGNCVCDTQETVPCKPAEPASRP